MGVPRMAARVVGKPSSWRRLKIREESGRKLKDYKEVSRDV
jgi:hypothetical protein